MPRNTLANPLVPLPPDVLPFGAVQHTLEPGSWLISPGLNSAHPYAGFSVDYLAPAFDFDADMFDITPEDGPCLPRTNSHTREAIAAAALGPAYPAAGLYGLDTTPRLRLALEPVSQLVAPPSSPATSRLDPDPDGRAETAPDPMNRIEVNREALFALFSGRLPRLPWPTAQLVGLDYVHTSDLPHLRAGRTDPPRNVYRPSAGGAFRGLEEWLTERHGAQRPLAGIVEPAEPDLARGRGRSSSSSPSDRDDRAYVTGFRLRAKRTSTRPLGGDQGARQGASASGSSGTADRWSPAPAAARGPEDPGGNPHRRRGVGPNGGMAVLWQGTERDPAARPPITVLRAGDDAEGGFVLRLPGSPPLPPTAPLPLGVEAEMMEEPEADPRAREDERPRPSEQLADRVDSAAEGFFPVKSPAQPLRWGLEDHATATDAHGQLLAHSLEGYWVGSYSSHGLEILNVTTGLAEFPRNGSAGEGDSSSSDSEDEDVTYRRVVTATKVTGDPNVPSGQVRAQRISPHRAFRQR